MKSITAILVLCSLLAFAQAPARHILPARIQQMSLPEQKVPVAIVTIEGGGERATYAAEIKNALAQCCLWGAFSTTVKSIPADKPGVHIIRHSQANMPDVSQVLKTLLAAGVQADVLDIGSPVAGDRPYLHLFTSPVTTDHVIIFVGPSK